jgi:hypothetical protein
VRACISVFFVRSSLWFGLLIVPRRHIEERLKLEDPISAKRQVREKQEDEQKARE